MLKIIKLIINLFLKNKKPKIQPKSGGTIQPKSGGTIQPKGATKTSNVGKALIKKWEGCELEAYRDAVGIITIGYGNTYYEDNSPIQMGDVITKRRAEELLDVLLPRYEKTVKQNINRPLNQNEFDALVSFCWNCGSSKTLFRLVNEKSPDTEQWWKTHYITAGGKRLNGLVKRRAEEAELYIS